MCPSTVSWPCLEAIFFLKSINVPSHPLHKLYSVLHDTAIITRPRQVIENIPMIAIYKWTASCTNFPSQIMYLLQIPLISFFWVAVFSSHVLSPIVFICPYPPFICCASTRFEGCIFLFCISWVGWVFPSFLSSCNLHPLVCVVYYLGQASVSSGV